MIGDIITKMIEFYEVLSLKYDVKKNYIHLVFFLSCFKLILLEFYMKYNTQ